MPDVLSAFSWIQARYLPHPINLMKIQLGSFIWMPWNIKYSLIMQAHQGCFFGRGAVERCGHFWSGPFQSGKNQSSNIAAQNICVRQYNNDCKRTWILIMQTRVCLQSCSLSTRWRKVIIPVRSSKATNFMFCWVAALDGASRSFWSSNLKRLSNMLSRCSPKVSTISTTTVPKHLQHKAFVIQSGILSVCIPAMSSKLSARKSKSCVATNIYSVTIAYKFSSVVLRIYRCFLFSSCYTKSYFFTWRAFFIKIHFQVDCPWKSKNKIDQQSYYKQL